MSFACFKNRLLFRASFAPRATLLVLGIFFFSFSPWERGEETEDGEKIGESLISEEKKVPGKGLHTCHFHDHRLKEFRVVLCRWPLISHLVAKRQKCGRRSLECYQNSDSMKLRSGGSGERKSKMPLLVLSSCPVALRKSPSRLCPTGPHSIRGYDQFPTYHQRPL